MKEMIETKVNLFQSHINLQVPFIEKENSEWSAKEIEIWNTTKSVLICRNVIEVLNELLSKIGDNSDVQTNCPLGETIENFEELGGKDEN